MGKIISLIMAGFMACLCYVGSQAEGYRFTAKDAGFIGTITPAVG